MMNRRARNLLCALLALVAFPFATGCDLDIIVPGYSGYGGGYGSTIIEVIEVIEVVEVHDPYYYQDDYYQDDYYQDDYYDFYVDF